VESWEVVEPVRTETTLNGRFGFDTSSSDCSCCIILRNVLMMVDVVR
jgi:hypothetical protein